jgi:hypothetical protein
LNIQALVNDDPDVFKQRLRITAGQRFHRPIEDFARNEPEHVAHIFVDNLLATKRDYLIQ